jgi:hypothetical protein
MILFLKIFLWFLAINYSVVLLKEIHALKRYKLLHALCFISLTILLILHPNFFSPILKFSNFQIIKLISCILLLRVPVVVLHWLLIDTLHLSISKEENTYKQSRGGWYPIHAANRVTITNGISAFKPTKEKFIWALMILALCGNWMSQHPLLCAGIVCVFYLYKNSLRILKFLKIS